MHVALDTTRFLEAGVGKKLAGRGQLSWIRRNQPTSVRGIRHSETLRV